MNNRRASLGTALLTVLLPALASCTNFHTVEEGRFYRSGQPGQTQLENWIERHKLKTVVRLRGGKPGDTEYEWTRKAAENKGIRFVHHRLSARRYPKKAELLGLWKIFAEGEYPMLVHCQSGADRAGLASAVYMLWRTNNVDKAAGQLGFWPYFHTGWFGAWKLDKVFVMYRPYQNQMSFPEWVQNVYRIPDQPQSKPSTTSRPAPAPARLVPQ